MEGQEKTTQGRPCSQEPHGARDQTLLETAVPTDSHWHLGSPARPRAPPQEAPHPASPAAVPTRDAQGQRMDSTLCAPPNHPRLTLGPAMAATSCQ